MSKGFENLRSQVLQYVSEALEDAEMRGFTVLRFTGSEIHNKPLACAKQIFEWVQLGW